MSNYNTLQALPLTAPTSLFPPITAWQHPPPLQVHAASNALSCFRALFYSSLTLADDDDNTAGTGGGVAKRQRLEALAGSDVASAYPDTSVQFDAPAALDHSSAVAAIAEAYAPVSRDKAAAEQEKREAAAAALKTAQAAAAAKRQRESAITQAVSKLDGVLSGIGGDGGGEALEWELPSEDEEEVEAAAGGLRSTEEWKQYVATYGQAYTERYFASYYHAQVVHPPPPLPSRSCCIEAAAAMHIQLLPISRLPPTRPPPLPPPSADAAPVRRRRRPRLPQAERAAHRPPAVVAAQAMLRHLQ